MIAQMFPQITNIGGYRANGGGSSDHPSGRALDIMIPNWDTPEGKQMGDVVNQWLQKNSDALGVESTIWQDFWKPVGGEGHSLGRMNQGPDEAHLTHVHAKFREALANGDPSGFSNDYNGPGGSRGDPMYVRSSDTSGEQLGKDIVSGVMEVFGFGDLFKDPTQFGLFKIFKSIMGLKPGGENRDNGYDNGSGGGGTGDPLMDFATSLIPGAGGRSIADDMAQWMPASGGQGSGGGIADFASQFVPQGPAVDNSQRNITIQGNVDAPAFEAFDNLYTSEMRNMPKP
jgi:hypothetical protein